MKKFLTQLIRTLLLTLALVACGSPEPVRPPLPTAAVPPLSEVDAAISRWESGNNQRYFVSVEETFGDESHLIRLVVVDGQIRAAQRLEKVQGGWGQPQAFPPQDARAYTVDALLERVRDDASGDGPSPVNLRVVFDPLLGYPAIAYAEALPTYNEQGQILLNREFGYELIVEVRPLLEDTFGLGETPLMTLTQSAGPEARCDSLRIFPDGSSIYADDCVQALIQLRLPAERLEDLKALGAGFGSLDVVQELDGETRRLILQGAGTGTPAEGTLQEAWELAEDFYNLLSRPVGAQLTLVYLQDGQLIGFDVYSQLSQSARLVASGTLIGAVLSQDGARLAYTDEAGLHWVETGTGVSNLVLPPLDEGGYDLPRAWGGQDRLLLTRVPDSGDGVATLGWIGIEGKNWQRVPSPVGIEGYGCDTGAAWDSEGVRLAIGGLGYGHPCNLNPGLAVVDLEAGTARLIVRREITSGLESGEMIIAGAHAPAWSPDGEWIAVSLDEPASGPLNFPARMHLVRPDGADLTPITTNAAGRAGHPVWSTQGVLYYSLSGGDADTDGVYQYDPTTRTHTRRIDGTGLAPVSVSPDGEFLLYYEGQDLMIRGLSYDLSVLVASPSEGVPVVFSGWLGNP